ncbi:hypothetical protein ASE86_07835 [Sphingomonas sp. Leaf33]|uniref:hypothetical protein n=1 Tax=Sphingomonas sp. Leaf33 TaxID=1736215 RepID=UPI0006FF1357|nr:hypothetical protein [Sphingomonas sp. Leaf33]KQN26062.1 hypothetical protein ASE86_07835 [Sphingomonas sp. Leaf33]
MKYRSLLLPIALSACASQPDTAPSLLPRAIETRTDTPIVRDETVNPDPALDGQIRERVATFDRAVAAFDAGRTTLGRRITAGRGAAEGSERWLDAQQALGELQQLRTATDGALTEIETLAIDRGAKGLLPYPALDAAIARAQGVVDRQVTEENRLRALLA